ncbi:MAG: hypothetical protein KDB03_09655 [Planctomycetales bacterium]|nr:hypothetical protein [Planctomycetales bacterium]
MTKQLVRIGPERTIVLDIIRLARTVPSFPVERWFDVAEVALARQRCQTRISWLAVFLRAYGLASREHAFLRQCYVRRLCPSIYQSDACVISVAVNRIVNGREQLFFARIRNPDEKTVAQLQQEIDRCQTAPVELVFRQQLTAARLPSWIRRFSWWWRRNLELKKRARRMGTGSMSVLAGNGTHNRLHPCMLTSSLSYGPMEADGRMWVTLQCDHRVLDGMAASRALLSIEEALQNTVLRELRGISIPSQSAQLPAA